MNHSEEPSTIVRGEDSSKTEVQDDGAVGEIQQSGGVFERSEGVRSTDKSNKRSRNVINYKTISSGKSFLQASKTESNAKKGKPAMLQQRKLKFVQAEIAQEGNNSNNNNTNNAAAESESLDQSRSSSDPSDLSSSDSSNEDNERKGPASYPLMRQDSEANRMIIEESNGQQQQQQQLQQELLVGGSSVHQSFPNQGIAAKESNENPVKQQRSRGKNMSSNGNKGGFVAESEQGSLGRSSGLPGQASQFLGNGDAQVNEGSKLSSEAITESLRKITEILKEDTERGQRKYEENQRKLDAWVQDVKMNFELSEDEEGGDLQSQHLSEIEGSKESLHHQMHHRKTNTEDLSEHHFNNVICPAIDNLLNQDMLLKEAENIKARKQQLHLNMAYLESKRAFLKSKRKEQFKMFQASVSKENNINTNSAAKTQPESPASSSSSSSSTSASNATTIENIVAEASKLQPSKNSKKIETHLQRLAAAIDGQKDFDPIELQLFKKFKVNTEKLLERPQENTGFKVSDFLSMKKFKYDPTSIPFCGSNFDDAKKAVVPPYHAVFNDKTDPFNRLINNPTVPRNGVQGGTQSRQAMQFKRKINTDLSVAGVNGIDNQANSPLRNKVQHNESYANWDEIEQMSLVPQERDIMKKKKLERLSKLPQEDQEKHQKMLFKKAWTQVVRNVIKIYRVAQQTRQDFEQNSRKFAILCAKEVRKKYSKSQRTQKDWAVRSKKMQREMVSYWRKRERELTEIKRRKEKLEADLKRREDEEKENLLQKKRLEFLMKQSDLYAHFMAQKLGITMKEDNPAAAGAGAAKEGEVPTGEPGAMDTSYNPLMFKGNQISIDENDAAFKVSALINEHRNELLKFDMATAKERDEIGTEEDKVVISEFKKTTATDLTGASKMDFSQVELETQNSLVKPPEQFNGTLKEYQLKGLRWLDNLYEQGINGILADEMGLGKTIQAIALITHIASTKNIWGPFLVISPSSTLYNWQQELKKFFPALKVLPYWGSLKQRKMIRKYLSMKSLGCKNSPFHLVITSYQLIVSDEKIFQRIKWQYMILDEAQAIKNINSMRWKTLLSFNSRNKLLLTGTPIQNTMAELWALLHFIMPKLFDSHDQFQEWFSKDIEASSQDKSQLNQHQLQRLHAILKPFMLRRVKKDVELEIGAKREFQIMCDMTKRQQKFYDNVKSKLSLKDFFKMFESKSKVDNLMNLVMQFRKVCNHPELFERRPCRSSFIFQNIYYYTGHLPARMGELKYVETNSKNAIEFALPRLVFDGLLRAETKNQFIQRKFGFLSAHNVVKDLLSNNKHSMFSFIRLLDLPFNIMEIYSKTDAFYLQLVLTHFLHTRVNKPYWQSLASGSDHESRNLWWSKDILEGQGDAKSEEWTQKFNPIRRNCNVDQIASIFGVRPLDGILLQSNGGKFTKWWNSIHQDAHNGILPVKLYCLIKRAVAPPIRMECSSAGYQVYSHSLSEAKIGRFLARASATTHFKTPFSTEVSQAPVLGRSLFNSNVVKEGMLDFKNQESFSSIEVVDFASLVADSAKLKYLDVLLADLKKKGHRVLIFCQMTRMIDILEDFMTRKKYKFFRLDGSCNISDRRDMVNDFQLSNKTFAFLLSTRAGGLGVTLTAADVVIFYDNDWNPTMDAQAMDRAHRIGQTKEVLVYRLVTRGTVEEKILKRAQQKQQVQSTVYSGGAFKADIWKPQEVMELLLDESEIKETQMFMPKRHKGPGAGTSQKAVQPKKQAEGGAGKPKKASKKDKKKDARAEIEGDGDMGEEVDDFGEENDGIELDGENQEDEFGINFENIMNEVGVDPGDQEEDLDQD